MSRYWQHCDWSDSPKRMRKQIAKNIIDVVDRFCRSATRKKLRMKEELFLEKLKDYAYYALCGYARDSETRMAELEKML